MEKIFEFIPRDFFEIVVIAVFSLIIGLSQKAVHSANRETNEPSFGTDRTFTFLGILGYILWISDATHLLYSIGLILISVFLALNYYFKVQLFKEFGLTTILVALITYALTAIMKTQPFWLFMMVYVVVLVMTELKESLNEFSKKVARDEFITLGKFLAIAGIVLPMAPDTPLVSFLGLTPYKVWLAVVIISTISYLSYLLRKFVFKDAGILLTGILGGFYSSTATTIVLARQSKTSEGNNYRYASAIVLSTSMMYVRIGILMAIFNSSLFILLLPGLLIMLLVSLAIAFGIFYFRKRSDETSSMEVTPGATNPLEFRIAIIFTLLFIAFSFITYFTLKYFGEYGLQVLAYVVGVTDIDPFLINLFNGKYGIELILVATATLQAIFSNNAVKLLYATSLSHKACRKMILTGLGILVVASFLVIWII